MPIFISLKCLINICDGCAYLSLNFFCKRVDYLLECQRGALLITSYNRHLHHLEDTLIHFCFCH